MENDDLASIIAELERFSPAVSISSEPAPDPEPCQQSKPRKLNLRLIKDPSLSLTDRIIHSYLWKWAWMNKNPKRFKPKAVTIRRIRRATGSRAETIKASLDRLRAGGYIDKRCEPFTKHDNLLLSKSGSCLYRKLEWESGHRLLETIFHAFRAHDLSNARKTGPAYYKQVLG